MVKCPLGGKNHHWLRGKEAWAMFSKSDKEGGLPRVEWAWGIHRRQGQRDDGGTPTQGPRGHSKTLAFLLHEVKRHWEPFSGRTPWSALHFNCVTQAAVEVNGTGTRVKTSPGWGYEKTRERRWKCLGAQWLYGGGGGKRAVLRPSLKKGLMGVLDEYECDADFLAEPPYLWTIVLHQGRLIVWTHGSKRVLRDKRTKALACGSWLEPAKARGAVRWGHMDMQGQPISLQNLTLHCLQGRAGLRLPFPRRASSAGSQLWGAPPWTVRHIWAMPRKRESHISSPLWWAQLFVSSPEHTFKS